MRRVLLSVVGLWLICTGAIRAQYDARFSQYFMSTGYYNPAYAGTSPDLNLLALSRLEWVGVHGAPKSVFVTADMPLKLGKTNHGVGMVVFVDGLGLFLNTHVAAQYAYKHKLFGGTLSIGLQVGLANQSFDGTKAYIPSTEEHVKIEEDDAIPSTQVQGMMFDINAGIYYTHKHFYVGLASTHLTEPEMQLDENAYSYLGRAYNLIGGYNIRLRNPLYELQPSVFLLTDMKSFHTDITARLEYNKMFNGGIAWRVNESIGVLLGAKFGRFQFGYAFDFATTPLGRSSAGSHELMVKYSLKLQKTKTGKNRHKSVRIL